MRHPHGALGGQARRAREDQGLVRRLPAGLHKQVAECRVGLVRARISQCDFEGRDQIDFDVLVAGIAQIDLTKLDVVFRADPDGGADLHVGPGGVEAGAVGMEGAVVVRAGVRRGMQGHGNWALLRAAAQVEKAAMRIAQPVVAPAVDPDFAPAAAAGAVGAQRHVVATVRQHQGRLDRGRARRHLAQQAALVAPLRRWLRCRRRRLKQHRHLARRALVQQGGDGLDGRIGHAPALGRAAQQHIGQRDDAHAMVVGHEGAHHGEALGPCLARGCEVQRFRKAVARAGAQLLQRGEVGRGTGRVDLRGQRGGIRGHHQFVRGRAAQRQPRHALWRVLVGERVVASGVGRFGDAPGHVQRAGKPDLLVKRGAAGLVQQAAARLRQDQARHEVFEHRARPRAQPDVRA